MFDLLCNSFVKHIVLGLSESCIVATFGGSIRGAIIMSVTRGNRL